MSSLALLLARIMLLSLFVYTGMDMLEDPASTASNFASHQLPAPQVLVWLVIALKLLGSAALLLGLYTRTAACALAAFSAAAAFIGHTDVATTDAMLPLFKDVAIIGGLLALAAAGPGALSVDASRHTH